MVIIIRSRPRKSGSFASENAGPFTVCSLIVVLPGIGELEVFVEVVQTVEEISELSTQQGQYVAVPTTMGNSFTDLSV